MGSICVPTHLLIITMPIWSPMYLWMAKDKSFYQRSIFYNLVTHVPCLFFFFPGLSPPGLNLLLLHWNMTCSVSQFIVSANHVRLMQQSETWISSQIFFSKHTHINIKLLKLTRYFPHPLTFVPHTLWFGFTKCVRWVAYGAEPCE